MANNPIDLLSRDSRYISAPHYHVGHLEPYQPRHLDVGVIAPPLEPTRGVILTEDGGQILTEDGWPVRMENWRPVILVTEGGGRILTESGKPMLGAI